MERNYGQSWIYRTFSIGIKVCIILILGLVSVNGVSDICEQQQQSSFHLWRLAKSTKSSKRCAELCCKDSKCTIPIRVKKHCYGITCAKKDLCQVIYEQLKDFQGHRVDKRDVDDEDGELGETGNWETDHGKELSIYQKRDGFKVDNSSIVTNSNQSGAGVVNRGFPAFLIQETSNDENEFAKYKRDVSSIFDDGYQGRLKNESAASEKLINSIYVSLNDSQDLDSEKTETVTKRSSDDNDDVDGENDDNDDDDDDDSVKSTCAADSKFHQSTIPRRKKNYHFKSLGKISKSMKSCSKKCCKTDNCILSFVVEKSCIGVLCSGDGDCHTKKDRLPKTDFELSVIKREATTSKEDRSTENDEQKRSTVQTKDDDADNDSDDDANDDVDGDVDGDIDGDDDDDDDEKKKSKKSHQSKKKKKSSRKHSKHLAKKKSENKEARKGHKKHKEKRKHNHKSSVKHKKNHVHKVEKNEDEEEGEEKSKTESSGSGQSENEGRHSRKKSGEDQSNEELNEFERKTTDSHTKNEYSDDVKHLIHSQKPMNSSLFDDTIVGDETEALDPDGEEAHQKEEENTERRFRVGGEATEGNDEDGGLKSPEEETAGRADESMKMRGLSVENDKRSDLMVAHRHYEDVEDAPRKSDHDDADDERRSEMEEYEKREKEHRRHHRKWKNDYDSREPNEEDHLDKYERKNLHRSASKHRYSKHKMFKEDYLRYHRRDPDKEQGEEDAEHSGRSPDKHHSSHHYIKFNSKSEQLEDSGEDIERSLHHHEFGRTDSHSKKSSKHKSSLHHSKKKKTSSKKKSSKKSEGKNKEEQLIEKLEHLEEKIEKKQKNEIESRKEKILSKVEKLANKLEKKTLTTTDKKAGEEKGSKKESKEVKSEKKKHHSKNSKKKTKKHSKKHEKERKKEESIGELENSGELAKHIEQGPEKIIIPPHHKSSKKKSKSHDSKKSHSSKKMHKKEVADVSGEGSSSADGLQKIKHEETLVDGSGGGEDDDGDQRHYLGFERDHKIGDGKWSQRDIVVPYVDKKHKHNHNNDQHMPALNEDILDGLDKMRYEKKDKINKPSKEDEENLKRDIMKFHAKHESEKKKKDEIEEAKHGSKKSHKKSKHTKHEKKSQKTHKTKVNKKKDLLTEFEKYKAFVQSQAAMEMSGEGSALGSGMEHGSGHMGVKIVKAHEAKKHKKHEHKKPSSKEKSSKEKPSKENSNKENSSKETKSKKHKGTDKKHKSKMKKKHSKLTEESVSSGHDIEGQKMVEEGSGEVAIKRHHKVHNEKSKHEEGKKKSHSTKVKESSSADNSTVAEKSDNSSIETAANKTKFQHTANEEGRSANDTSIITKEPKMFHDRKESSAGDDVSSANKSSHVPVKDKNVSPKHKTKSIEDSFFSPTKPHGEVISERNTSWSHKGSESNEGSHGDSSEANDEGNAHAITKPTEGRDSHVAPKNKTLSVKDSPTKRVGTTMKLTSSTRKTTTVKKTTTTPTPRTTKATKPKTTRKKTTHKRKTKKTTTTTTKRPVTIMTTTVIPTLNIFTGDEDVEAPDTEPSVNVHKPTKGKGKKATAKGRKVIKKPKQNRPSQNVRKPSSHSQMLQKITPPPIQRTPLPTTEPIPPFPLIYQNQPMQQQMTGPGGSTGVLGDLQLPEPPGDGNVKAGPPYYGQQGPAGHLPLQGPLGAMQYHNGQFAPGQLPVSGANELRGQENEPMVRQQPQPTMMSFQSPQFPGYYPMEKPTTRQHVKPSAAPSRKQLHNNIPQSPQNVIQRILGGQHIQSPVHVIQKILGKPVKQSPPVLIHNNAKATVKPAPKKPSLQHRPTNVDKMNRPGQAEPGRMKPGQVKPALKSPTLPHKKPSPSAKKPGAANPSKNGRKPVQNNLSDFFKNANIGDGPKATATPPKAAVPKPVIPKKQVPESSAPISPKGKKDDESCPIRENMQNMVLTNGRKSGKFTRMPGYPNLDACIKECCKAPTCDLLFKSGEVCYLVECQSQQSCKTEPLKEPTIRTRIVFVNKPQAKKSPAKPALCEGENAFGINWKETKPGNFATRTCPREAKGTAKRRCNEHAKWFTPDFSGCVSDEYTNLREDVKHLGFTSSVKDVLTKLEDVTTQTIDNSLVFGGDIIKASNVLEEISNYVTKNHAERFGFGALRHFVRSASNLLDDTNRQEWENVNHSLKGPGKIMKALENFGVVTAGKIPPINNNQPIITNNLVMSVAHMTKPKKYVFPNFTIPLLKKWTTKRDHIILPSNLFNSGIVKVASMNYKTLADLLPHQWSTANHVTFTDGFRINSKVIAASIFPKPKQKINPPVTIVLHHLKEINTPRTKCVYWDFSSNTQNGGSWSSDGCWVVTSNATVTVCQCDHLTHFAVLMNLSDEDRVSAKEQAKENTFALMWLGIPVLVVLSVGAMYTCFAWSKAPRRRHVVVKDGKPRLPEDEVIVTKTVTEDFPGSPNRYLYSSYNSPSPSDLEWEHVWDFLTNSEFENWQNTDTTKRKRSRRRRLELRPPRLLRGRRKKMREKTETSEYFSEGDSSSIRWKHQDDNEWSRERIKCLGKGIVDISSEASQPVDSLEEFSDDTSVADSKDGDKCSNSFDNFSPDAISSPRSGYCAEPRYYSFVYRSNLNLKEREHLHMIFKAESNLLRGNRALHSSCSSLETLRSLQPSGIQKMKYASTTCLVTLGKKGKSRFGSRKWSSKISLASSTRTVTHSVSSGFLDKTWSSKYASSLSISTLARSLSTKTINEDVEGLHSGCESISQEQGYGTFESSGAFSNDIMDMNITSSDIGLESENSNASKMFVSNNIPTYDMNLLTPSKKPLPVLEKPVGSSSLDNSWIDDFHIVKHNFDHLVCERSDVESKPTVGLKEPNLIKEASIINIDRITRNVEMKLDSLSKVFVQENAKTNFKELFSNASVKENVPENEISCHEESHPHNIDKIAGNASSSLEDLGIDMSSGSIDKFEINDRNEEESHRISSPRISANESKDNSRKNKLKVITSASDTENQSDSCNEHAERSRSPRARAIGASGRNMRQINIPRTSNIKRRTKILKKKIEKPVKSNTGKMTRSPTKHMRSYIVLRQQSRYSDHERQSSVLERQESLVEIEEKYSKCQNNRSVKATAKRKNSSLEFEHHGGRAKMDHQEAGQIKEDSDIVVEQVQIAAVNTHSPVKGPGKPTRIMKPTVSFTDPTISFTDIKDSSFIDDEDQMRRCLETSVFGSTLKRWKGRSKLYSLRK